MAGKIILGAAMLLIGLWLLIPGIYSSGIWWNEFLTLLKGFIPLFLIFIGFILVWVESEEMRIRPAKRK